MPDERKVIFRGTVHGRDSPSTLRVTELGFPKHLGPVDSRRSCEFQLRPPPAQRPLAGHRRRPAGRRLRRVVLVLGRLAHPLQLPARTDDRSPDRRLRKAERRRRAGAIRGGRGPRQPDRAGGRRQPGRRRPDREHAAARTAGRQGPARRSRLLDPRRGALALQLAERPLGRSGRARDGDGLQPGTGRRRRTAGLDPRPRQARMERQAGDRPLRARLRADRQRDREARRRSRREVLARRLRRQRQALQRQRGDHRRRRQRPDRRRDHQPLLLV